MQITCVYNIVGLPACKMQSAVTSIVQCKMCRNLINYRTQNFITNTKEGLYLISRGAYYHFCVMGGIVHSVKVVNRTQSSIRLFVNVDFPCQVVQQVNFGQSLVFLLMCKSQYSQCTVSYSWLLAMYTSLFHLLVTFFMS